MGECKYLVWCVNNFSSKLVNIYDDSRNARECIIKLVNNSGIIANLEECKRWFNNSPIYHALDANKNIYYIIATNIKSGVYLKIGNEYFEDLGIIEELIAVNELEGGVCLVDGDILFNISENQEELLSKDVIYQNYNLVIICGEDDKKINKMMKEIINAKR